MFDHCLYDILVEACPVGVQKVIHPNHIGQWPSEVGLHKLHRNQSIALKFLDSELTWNFCVNLSWQ